MELSNENDIGDENGAMGMDQPGKKSRAILPLVMDGIFGIFIFIIASILVYWSFAADGVVLFAWHPALLSAGFIFFMTQAINTNGSRFFSSFSNRITVHWVLNTIAMICITGGFSAIFVNKIRLGKSHFHTPHAIFGLTTFILLFIVSAGGVVAKYSFKLRRKIRPIVTKLSHSICGLLVYYLGGITLILGFFSKWFEKNRAEHEAYVMLTAVIIIWFYVSIRPLGQIFRRVKQMWTSI